jgi:aminoglycoside phosphotransferase (APT) family kinase protein
VYAWGAGRVLKLYYAGKSQAAVEREYRVTRAVRAAGLPAPEAYEVIEVEGRWGVVLERVEGPSLFDATQRRPWRMFAAVRQMADLHAAIHRCVAPADLPTQRERLVEALEVADLPDAEKDEARRRLAELPDGTAVCHGDFHPGNVLLTARGPVVIDWDLAGRGHPPADVARTVRLIRNASLPPWTPRPFHWLLAASRRRIERAYLMRYFQLMPGTRAEVERWLLPVTAKSASK